jgi:hypothetical protein
MFKSREENFVGNVRMVMDVTIDRGHAFDAFRRDVENWIESS